MPFLSVRDNREVSQNLTQASFVEEASFGETFAAGVGQVFDEELSISSMLNMQGFNQRKEQVKELGNSGAFNINEYTSAVGDVDYERISSDFPDFKIKNDKTLFDERAELLKGRREYAQDVFDRGNGMAQFLGMATAYMLDPINIATMPIATAGTATKGLSAIGRAIQVGKNEAGLAVAAELMIQPLVYQHKHDINSPFEFKDALLNIVTAATGAAAIGGLTGGISGYLKNVREKTVDLPLDDDAVMALNSLARIEDDLNLNKPDLRDVNGEQKSIDEMFIDADIGKIQSFHVISDDYNNLLQADFDAKVKIKANTIKKLNKLDKEVRKESLTVSRLIADEGGLNKAEWESEGFEMKRSSELKGGFNKPFLRAGDKGLTPDGLAEVLYQKGLIKAFDKTEALDFVDNLISYGNRFVDDGVNVKLMDIERSIDELLKSDDDLLESVYFGAAEREIQSDAEFMAEMNNKMEAANQPSKVKENYTQPEKKAATTGSVSQRERAVVERNGLTKDYDADIEAFKALDNPRIVQDDVVVDANAFMKSMDDEIKGIEEVLTCAI